MQTQRNWTYMYTYKMFKTLVIYHLNCSREWAFFGFHKTSEIQFFWRWNISPSSLPAERKMSTKRQDTPLKSCYVSKMKVDMFDSRPSTSRDEAAIGQLKIGVVVHDATSEETFIFLRYLLLLCVHFFWEFRVHFDRDILTELCPSQATVSSS